jgi:benzoate-CoA ligase family protein
MNLVEFVFRAARELGRWSQPAILYEDRQFTYEQLLRLVKRYGRMIQALGINPGDRVAIVACDCPEFIISFLGSAAVRSVAVPISTVLAAAELEYVLNHCGAKALVITSEQVEKLQSIRKNLPRLETVLLIDGDADGMLSFSEALSDAGEAEVEPVDTGALAFILYTSGSTGQPKGAMHLHRNLPYTVETFCKHILQVKPEDRLFSSSRLFFAYGLGNSLSFPLSSGATTILCKDRPTPPLIAEVFKKYSPTIFFGVPAVFRALIEYASQGDTLATDAIKFCVSAGEKLPERIFYEWKELTGLDILDGIGSTEMLQIFISNTRDRMKPGSSGRVVPGYEAKIVDQKEREIVGPGTGNLLIKGSSASPGYWENPEKTAATMQGEWIRTGDLYRRDEEGNFWFEGRSDDLFKVKGLWVSPVEVEDALLSCPDVLEAAVVPGLNEDEMNTVVAYVVLRSKQSHDDVRRGLKTQVAAMLPSYKCPTEIHFTDQLPRTATGKLQRFKLRDKRSNSE